MSIPRRVARWAAFAIVAGPGVALCQNSTGSAPMLRVEVQDSIGLPLPDASVEVFAPIEGSKFWEWAPVRPETLPIGIFLLRFSRDGYEPSVFSVPLELYHPVALRVRLSPKRDTLPMRKQGEAHEVRAIGLARVGRRDVDVIRFRRVLHRSEIERAGGGSLPEVLRRTKGTELITNGGAGSEVETVLPRKRRGCVGNVIVNGDRHRVLTDAQFESVFSVSTAEFIEVQGWSLKPAFDHPRDLFSGCASLMVWFKVP